MQMQKREKKKYEKLKVLVMIFLYVYLLTLIPHACDRTMIKPDFFSYTSSHNKVRETTI